MKITQVVRDEKSELCNKTASKWTRTFFCAHFKAGRKRREFFDVLGEKKREKKAPPLELFQEEEHSLKMLNCSENQDMCVFA